MKFSRPQALIFDLDGTLVHSLPDLAAAVDRLLLAYGLPLAGEARVGQWIGQGSQKLIEQALCRSLACGMPVPSAELQQQAHARFLDIYSEEFCRRTALYAGAREVLQSLHAQGLPLAIVTNKPQRFVTPLLQHLQLDEFFALCIGGDTLAQKKPHPAPLLHVCESLGVAPSAALMVGYSRNDIAAARAAGMPVVAFRFGYNHGEPIEAAGADALLDHWSQLPALWERA